MRWRRIDLCDVVEQRFGIRVAERTTGAILHRLGRAIRRATPKHKRYIKNLAELARAALPDEARGKPSEIWLQDEARVGQQRTLTRVWATKGTRPQAPKACRNAWAYIFGAVCPTRRIGAALVMPYANTEAMNAHLAEISGHVSPGAHALLVLYGAGWHSSTDLTIPSNISLLPRPVRN